MIRSLQFYIKGFLKLTRGAFRIHIRTDARCFRIQRKQTVRAEAPRWDVLCHYITTNFPCQLFLFTFFPNHPDFLKKIQKNKKKQKKDAAEKRFFPHLYKYASVTREVNTGYSRENGATARYGA